MMEDGRRAVTVVLVHGAWANASSWDKVIALLLAKAQRVIAVHFPSPPSIMISLRQIASLIDNLRASEYLWEQVDEVSLTHLHADHVGGIVAERRHRVPECHYSIEPGLGHIGTRADRFIWIPGEYTTRMSVPGQ